MAHLVLGTPVGGAPHPRLVLIALVGAYAGCVAILCLVRALFAPSASGLRLINISDESAAYLMRWSRRLVVVTVFGYALGEAGRLLGLSDIAREALFKAVGLIDHIFVAIIVVQKRRTVRNWLRAPGGQTGVWAQFRNRFAAVWHWIALFYIAALWLVWAVEVPNGFSTVLRLFVVTSLVLTATRIALILLHGSLDRLITPSEDTLTRYPAVQGRLRVWRPLLHVMADTVVYMAALVQLLQVWGFGAVALADRHRSRPPCPQLGHRCAGHAAAGHAGLGSRQPRGRAASGEAGEGGAGGALGAAAHAAADAAHDAAGRHPDRRRPADPERDRREHRTAAGRCRRAGHRHRLRLAEAGAGRHHRHCSCCWRTPCRSATWSAWAGLTGTVEDLSVRAIRLRAEDGSVHVIPFSAVTTVTNMTRDFGHAVIEVGVAYKEDYDHVIEVMRDIVAEMRGEPRWEGEIRDELEVMGLNAFGDSSVMIKARIKCGPFGRWSVGREFNRRLKLRFEQEGIEIPYPHQALVLNQPIAIAGHQPAASVQATAMRPQKPTQVAAK